MVGFRKIIDGKKFIFELLAGDEETESVYLVSTLLEKGPISFGMIQCNETCWCFTSDQLPAEIDSLREKLSDAILDSHF